MRITHGLSDSLVYKVWQNMKNRCENPKYVYYHRYGGRGISYDPRWKEFSEFYLDMGNPPQGMTLDRINNDGNYCKDNCRWASKKTQAMNRGEQRFKGSKSGYRGIKDTGYGKWRVDIKKKYIGSRDTLEEAIHLYNEALIWS